MAYKVFTNGSVLNASEINDNLMNQSIAVFSNAAARTAAITSPVEGQMTYLEDLDTYYTWTGSAWVSNSPGLVLLNNTAFTSSSLVRVNSIFSASFDNYLIKLDYKSSVAGSQILQLKYLTAVDTPTTLSLYNQVGLFASPSGLGNYSANSEATTLVGVSGNVNGASSIMEIHRPFIAARTMAFVQFIQNDSTTLYEPNTSYQDDTSFNGFQLTPNTGTITGTVKTYGYRNA